MPNEHLWRHFGISFSKEAEIPEEDSETKPALNSFQGSE
jgi:hypothetical protein